MRPVDRQELLARVSTQIRRYRYTERLRTSVRASMEMAITDALTGLYNRRYLETHLAHLIEHAVNRGKARLGADPRRRFLQVGERHLWP